MAFLAVACALLVPALSAAQSPSSTSSLLVKLVDGLSAQEQADVIARDGGIERSVIPVLRLHVIDVPASDLATVRANYQADPQVVSVEENQTRVSETVPGDPLYPNQWALPQIGWDQVFGKVAPAGTATVALLDTGVDAFHTDIQAAIDYAASKGAVLVAAVGNDAVSHPTFPAGARGVMGVSATDSTDTLASFSNRGQAVFLAAPGTDIQTTDAGDAYTIVSGTSASAAIVAGAAAFMR